MIHTHLKKFSTKALYWQKSKESLKDIYQLPQITLLLLITTTRVYYMLNTPESKIIAFEGVCLISLCFQNLFQVLSSEAAFNLCNLFWCSSCHNAASFVATFRTQIDNIICRFNYFKIMFNNYECVPCFN